MADTADATPTFQIDVTTDGAMPGADEYVRSKLGELGRYTRRPVLHARVRLTRHQDGSPDRPVVAQGNFNVDGRFIRAQVEGANVREAVDRLESRLRQQIERITGKWEAKRDQPRPTHRPSYFPRAKEDREIIRRKSYTLATATVDEAVDEMELLDYDFHLFTEKGTGQDCVLYRDDEGYRLAQVTPTSAEELAPHGVPLTISPHPAPELSLEEARQRMNMLGVPFLYFVEADSRRGNVLYHRYDGHYGLLTPADA
ncbi:ribosome hibernation promotion factor [Mycolicibacterium thermoresistibile]